MNLHSILPAWKTAILMASLPLVLLIYSPVFSAGHAEVKMGGSLWDSDFWSPAHRQVTVGLSFDAGKKGKYHRILGELVYSIGRGEGLISGGQLTEAGVDSWEGYLGLLLTLDSKNLAPFLELGLMYRKTEFALQNLRTDQKASHSFTSPGVWLGTGLRIITIGSWYTGLRIRSSINWVRPWEFGEKQYQFGLQSSMSWGRRW